MARRLSKEERQLLETQALNQWLAEEYERRNRFAGVKGGVASTAPIVGPPAPVEEEEEEDSSPFSGTISPEQQIVREQLRNELGLAGTKPDPAALDSALGFAGMLADVAGTAVDALSPDPHILDPSTFGPAGGHSGLASTGQHLYDVALEIPGTARGILEWAGLERPSRALGLHGLLEAAEGRAGETIEERERRAQAVAEARQEAGLPAIEDLRYASPFNYAADALYGLGDTIRGYTSPELKAAQEGLGQAVQDSLGSTLRYLASEPGMRALTTGVIPESAAYAAPQLTVARGFRTLGAGRRLSQGAANTLTAYTVAQQNAREVADGIMSLSPEEALQLPDVAAEYARIGNIDVAKSIVANRARLTALAGGVLTSPLYGIDSFSRMGAGVAQRATATMPVRAITVGGRETLGEIGQEGMEAVTGDLGRLRAGQISRDEVGATALPQAALGGIAGGTTATGASVAQSISEFDARARRLEEAAERLEALNAARAAEEQARADAEQARAAEAEAEAAAPSDDIDVEAGNALLRAEQEDAAWEQRNQERAREQAWEEQRQSIERRVDTARENVEALQERVDAGDTSQATLASLTEALIEEREAASALEGHMRNDPSLRGPDTMTIEPAPAVEEQAETAEEIDARIREEELRTLALHEAREFDRQEQERGDKEANKRLAIAKGQHTRKRRAHLAEVREANLHLDPAARAEVIADAAIEWDAANPHPTLETLPPEAPRASRPRAPQRPVRTPRPGSRPAPTAPEAAVEPVAEEAPTTVPQDRREALRARYGRAQEGGEAPAGRTAAEVLRELAKRVRRGTDKSALEAEALLTGGKLSIVDPEVMATVRGATEATEGFYDGERMYINAATLPAGDPVGVLFNSVLAHEADHAASASRNPDAVSKVRMLLEDAPRRKLIEQLETANHPTAIAAREAVAARNIDKETDPSRYEDELVAYAINHAIESGGRSWAPIRGLVSAARRKMKEYTGSDNLNLDDLGYYARATVNALAESEAGINAPGVTGREQRDPRELIRQYWAIRDAAQGRELTPFEQRRLDQLSEEYSALFRANMARWPANAPRSFSAEGLAASNSPEANTAYDGSYPLLPGTLVSFFNRNAEGGRSVGRVVSVANAALASEPPRYNYRLEYERDGVSRQMNVQASVIKEIVSDVSDVSPFVGREQTAIHGSQHTFEPEEGAPFGRFRRDKAFTGEGAQVYGAGHYQTKHWDTAENRYRLRYVDEDSSRSSPGSVLGEAIEGARLELDDPSSLAEQHVIDRLGYFRESWEDELQRAQKAADDAEAALENPDLSLEDKRAAEADLRHYTYRSAEIEQVLDLISRAQETADNSTLAQMQQIAEDSTVRDGGEVYYTDIPEDNELMHWQEPINTRSQEMQDALLSIDPDANLEQPFASWYIQRSQSKGLGRAAGDRAVSDELAAVGIKGHEYTGLRDGPQNFVIYSDEDVRITGRDRRELGETRMEMWEFGEEIQSRPTSSRSLREQFEAEARERAAADRAARPRTELELAPFEGRAQEPVSKAQEAAANQNRGPYLRTKGDDFAAGVKDLFTIHGSIGEGTGVLMQEANYARDAVYQTAIHRYHRVGPAMDRAADKAMANEEGTLREKRARFNDMILERIDNIAKLPSEDVKDKALARLVQQYPDLAPLQEAIHDINKMTEEIISARFAYADSRPLTEEEWTLYDYMHNNKYGYLTNVYAAFQGKDGKKYAEAVMSAGREGLAALSRGEEVPANIKRLYQVYDDALTFVMNNDVAVSDPEMLAAMDLQDVRELYNRWMPDDISADALATEFREANNGILDTDSYKAYMEDAIAEHVSILQDPEFVTEDGTTGSQILHNEANAVLNGLLGLTPLPNTALRYAKVRGIDTTVLEHRKPLPGPIAELYGQIRDIPSLINATLTRQGELASRLKFFNKLATEAYGDAVVSAADRHKAGNENFTVPLNGPSFGRLNGMYTTHEMAQRLTDYGSMFTDLVDTIAVVGINPTIGRKWMEHRVGKAWTTGAGIQKAMKIVTRPDYILLNLAGSFAAPVLAGGVKPAHLLTGMKVALEHIALQIDPKGRAIGPELSAAHQLALQTGAFDNAITQELRRAPRKLVNRLLEEMTTVDTVGEAMSLLKRAYNWSNDRGWQTLVESYSLADTWVKLPVLLERMDYLESYYRANGDSVSNDRIQEEAARYMRDATISMDNVPGFAKLLERGGISFYLPYFASVFRTLHKSNIHIVDSLEMAANAKTPEARWIAHKDAGRKLAGVSAVWATAATGLRLVAEMGMSDDDREQMERDRELMFDEGKYGDLTYVGTNDQGHRQYFVASRTDQFGPAFDAVRRFQRTGSVAEALKSIPEELLGLLVMNRFFGTTIDHIARGGKDTQLERTFPKATEFLLTQANKVPGGYAAMDYALTVGDLITPAGIMNYFDPRNKTPVEVDGDAAAILAALAQGTGHTLLTVNPEAALRGKGWAVSNHRDDANRRIRDSIQNLGPMQGFKTFLREASRERALMEDLGNAYHAMIDSGMSRQQVEEMISSVDATTIRNLRNRAYTSESARWIKEFSGLLSKNSINNPPEFRDLPEEERAEAQEEWKRQAYEVNRMLNALGLEENK